MDLDTLSHLGYLVLLRDRPSSILWSRRHALSHLGNFVAHVSYSCSSNVLGIRNIFVHIYKYIETYPTVRGRISNDLCSDLISISTHLVKVYWVIVVATADLSSREYVGNEGNEPHRGSEYTFCSMKHKRDYAWLRLNR